VKRVAQVRRGDGGKRSKDWKVSMADAASRKIRELSRSGIAEGEVVERRA